MRPGVLGVDGQVRDLPDVVGVADREHALLDGVLVRAGEGGVDELADVGVAHVDRQPVRVLGDVAGLVDVADVELGVDALGEEVEREVDDVDVAGALPVAEERPLDAVGAGEDAELGRGDAGAAVVVRVQRDDDACRGASTWRRNHSIASA